MAIIGLCSGLSLFANPLNNTEENAMHFVHLKAKDVGERSQIAQYIHIDQVIEEDVYAAVNSHDLTTLKTFLADKIVESHSLTFDDSTNLLSADEYEFPKKDAAYHTHEELLSAIDNLQTQYPTIVETFTIGTTVENRKIPLIRITHENNRSFDYFTPGVLFTGAHHAREHLSTEIPIMLAQHLAKNYEINPYIKKLINTRDIYIVPTLNIDGKLYDIKGRKYKLWRKNRSLNQGSRNRGVDLNRNYSYRWGTGGSSKSPHSDTYMGPTPFSEPETLAIKNFIETAPNVRIMLSYHTYSELILYPWGHTYNSVGGTDQQIFEKMAQEMSEWNDYAPQQASDLYIASGDACDWAYGEHSIYCFTFELTPNRFKWGYAGFYPGAKVIEPTFNVNIAPALYLIEYSDDPSRVLSENKLY